MTPSIRQARNTPSPRREGCSADAANLRRTRPALNTPATSATVTVIDAMIGYPPNLIDTPNTDAPVRESPAVPVCATAMPSRPSACASSTTCCTLCASSVPSASASTPACTSRARYSDRSDDSSPSICIFAIAPTPEV